MVRIYTGLRGSLSGWPVGREDSAGSCQLHLDLVWSNMGHQKRTDTSQGNTMEQYTTPVVFPQRTSRLEVSGDAACTPLNAGEPSQAELLVAIQGSRVALEGKIETVTVEVNLLRADLRKVSDKVKVVEGSIAELQSEVGTLRKQVAQATSTVGRLEARLVDVEGRSRRNNVRLLGFQEHTEGSAMVSFVENWIKDVLQPTGLSRVFVLWRVQDGDRVGRITRSSDPAYNQNPGKKAIRPAAEVKTSPPSCGAGGAVVESGADAREPTKPSDSRRAGELPAAPCCTAPRDRAVKHRGLQKRKAEPAGTALTTQRGATAKQRPAHTRSEGRLRRHPSPRNRAEKPLSACGLEECGGGCRAGYGIAEIPAGVGGEVLRGGRPDPL
ncbi:hypothetical protein NDU88_002016 [Pleurodeles waltl]|uniref:Uncharacterized protein n=1 Tax=Pleurodeles waltl TaxID=8319 RepID=A0AAV7KXR3_PLEWA|nr:hypothetical protein NDU88_002016 [Pleurodeles waltl]